MKTVRPVGKSRDLVADDYLELRTSIDRALDQLRSMDRGEGQSTCATCGDNDHTAENCAYFNPLLLAAIGRDALLGQFWKCFHCGAWYTNEEAAAAHFGKTPATAAECLRRLVELAL